MCIKQCDAWGLDGPFPPIPEPTPSLIPPSRWLASLSRSQTVSSTQASDRSVSLMPSYTIVWLNTGSTVLRSTRVFCRLFLLVSGSMKLQITGKRKYEDWHSRKLEIISLLVKNVNLPLNVWVNGRPDQRQVLAFLHPNVNLSSVGTVFSYTFKEEMTPNAYELAVVLSWETILIWSRTTVLQNKWLIHRHLWFMGKSHSKNCDNILVI